MRLSADAKNAIYSAVDRVVDYAHREAIDTVVLTGARVGHFYELFRIVWGKKYKEPSPKFVSPGHNDYGDIRPREFPPTTRAKEMRAQSVKNRLVGAGLDRKIGKKPLIFDEVGETSMTVQAFEIALKELGFEPKIAVLFANPDFKVKNAFAGIRTEYLHGSTSNEIMDFIEDPKRLRFFREFSHEVAIDKDAIKRTADRNKRNIRSLKKFVRHAMD